MAYKCPQCGNTAEEMGNCPTCNVPMQTDAGSEGQTGKAAGESATGTTDETPTAPIA